LVLFVLSLLFVSVVHCDPIDLNVTVFTNVSYFTISPGYLNFSHVNGSSPGLLTPFQYNSLSEVLSCNAVYAFANPFPINAEYLIDSAKGLEFETEGLRIVSNQTTLYVPTLGPCFTNGLRYQLQGIWSKLAFQNKSATPYTLTCSITRVYQNALIVANQNYWIYFGPGKDPYYGLIVPITSSNLALQVTITRVNASLPLPSALFTSLDIATQQKCLNPGIPDENLPGIVESFSPVADTSTTLSHAFRAVLPSNTLVYLKLLTHYNYTNLADIYHGYYFNVSLPVIQAPPPPPPPLDHTGTTFAIICVVLIVIGACGLAYYFCVIRKRQQLSLSDYSAISQ